MYFALAGASRVLITGRVQSDLAIAEAEIEAKARRCKIHTCSGDVSEQSTVSKMFSDPSLPTANIWSTMPQSPIVESVLG